MYSNADLSLVLGDVRVRMSSFEYFAEYVVGLSSLPAGVSEAVDRSLCAHEELRIILPDHRSALFIAATVAAYARMQSRDLFVVLGCEDVLAKHEVLSWVDPGQNSEHKTLLSVHVEGNEVYGVFV